MTIKLKPRPVATGSRLRDNNQAGKLINPQHTPPAALPQAAHVRAHCSDRPAPVSAAAASRRLRRFIPVEPRRITLADINARSKRCPTGATSPAMVAKFFSIAPISPFGKNFQTAKSDAPTPTNGSTGLDKLGSSSAQCVMRNLRAPLIEKRFEIFLKARRCSSKTSESERAHDRQPAI